MLTNDLRPLGLGELLDRAVTLFVRRFGVLVTTLAVAYVPFLFVQWALLGHVFTRKPTTLTRGEWLAVGLELAAGIFVFVLTRTAVAAVAHAAYMSRTISLRAAYRLAAQRFSAQIVTFVIAGLLWIAVLLGIAFVVVMVAAAVLGEGTPGPAAIVSVLGILTALAGVPSAWLFLGFEVATVRIAIGTPRPNRALFEALGATVFRRPWQSLLAAVTLMLVALGGSLITSALLELIPSAALRTFLSFTVSAAESIVFEGLTVAFVVVYVVDIMIRNEGLDLAVALESPEPAAGAAR